MKTMNKKKDGTYNGKGFKIWLSGHDGYFYVEHNFSIAQNSSNFLDHLGMTRNWLPPRS
jgi:hypothetical protein